MKVLVVLHYDRLDVLEVPIFVGVVVGGNNDAEGEFVILTNIVSLFIIILLLLS